MAIELRLSVDDARLRRALQDPALINGPIATFLKKAALTVQGRAMLKAPVDTGRLRSSIVSSSRPSRGQVSIFTPVFYAPFVEFGTRPHMPPLSALQPWARRHGFRSAWPLALAISRRGTRPHPFMRPALKESLPDIQVLVTEAARDIERRWKGG